MTTHITQASTLRTFLITSAIAMGLAPSTGVTAAEKSNKDRETCLSIGATPGSSAFTNCMLQQQQREDEKMLNLLAEQRMHQELGRPAREKLEAKRARRERDT